jgi:DeoR/GlpR family transcriptional regulator of sugar metabolism
MLKEERQDRILDILAAQGRVVATELQEALAVSGYTIRRDLDELARAGRLQRVHGGALARSTVARTYEGRQTQGVEGKIATARAAATLLEPGQVAIVDGGSTALHFVDAIPAGHTGTCITHSPPVATALARRPGLQVVLIGGTLDPHAMVAVGAQAIQALQRVTADICFLGVWSLHPSGGLTNGYYEEAEVRAVMVERADRVVALASREKLGTVAPFAVAPATALTDLATEPDLPGELLAPYAELGIRITQLPAGG